jgi:hypothetical protein
LDDGFLSFGVACRSFTDVYHVFADRLQAKLMVKSGDPIDFAQGEIKIL